jgi:hypothetical protein
MTTRTPQPTHTLESLPQWVVMRMWGSWPSGACSTSQVSGQSASDGYWGLLHTTVKQCSCVSVADVRTLTLVCLALGSTNCRMDIYKQLCL